MQKRLRIKDLKLTTDDHSFDGSDPILVFDFLTRMVAECDNPSIGEAQAILVLTKFLTGAASGQYRTARN